MEKKLALRGMLLTLFGGTLWGFSGTCGQFLLQTKGLTSDWLVPIRLFSAGLALVLLCLVREKSRAFVIWRENAGRLLVFGVLGMSMCQYTYFTAIGASNAGTATVLQYLGPVLIMIYLSVRSRQMPSPTELAAIVLAVLGTFLLATHGKPGAMALSGKALFWGLASAVALAIYTVQPVPLLNRYGSAMVTGWGMLVGGVALGLLFRPWMMQVQVDSVVVLGMALIIFLGTVAAFTAYLEGIRCVGPKKGSLYASIEPVSATIFSFLWMKTEFGYMDLLGFACILSTIFLLSAGSPRTGSHIRNKVV